MRTKRKVGAGTDPLTVKADVNNAVVLDERKCLRCGKARDFKRECMKKSE